MESEHVVPDEKTEPVPRSGRAWRVTSRRNDEPAQERQLRGRDEQTNEGQSVFHVAVHVHVSMRESKYITIRRMRAACERA